MPFTTHRGDHHLFLGDSTSDATSIPPSAWWFGVPNCFADQLQAQAAALPALTIPARLNSGSGSGRVASGTARQGNAAGLFTFKSSGVPGALVSTVDSLVPSLVTAKGANFIWIACGINDVLNGSVTVPAFTNNYTSLVADVHAAMPNAKIICLSITVHNEVWAAGPVWNNGPDDAKIDSFNSAIGTIAAGASSYCAYLDWRALILQWEVTNNPAKDPSGHITYDGIHPSDPGKPVQAGWALSMVTVAL